MFLEYKNMRYSWADMVCTDFSDRIVNDFVNVEEQATDLCFLLIPPREIILYLKYFSGITLKGKN